MLDLEIFVRELGSVYRLSPCAVALCRIASLAHEAGNDAMELAAAEIGRFHGGAREHQMLCSQGTTTLCRVSQAPARLHQAVLRSGGAEAGGCVALSQRRPTAAPSAVMKRFALLPTAQHPEVFSCFRRSLSVEAQDNPSRVFAVDLHRVYLFRMAAACR